MPHKRDMLAERVPTDAAPDLTAAIARLTETSLAKHLPFFDQQRRWINERHLEICRVPSATFREQQRADYLVGLFREMGHQARLDDAGNVVCPIVFGEELPFVAVSAHMDTVIAPRQISDVYVRPDGTMEGPGVTDNGSGLAALVALAPGLSGRASGGGSRFRICCSLPMSPRKARVTCTA